MRIIFFLFLTLGMAACSPVKYFIVRHAEKEIPAAGTTMITSGDPALSPAGKVRAIELREELKNENIRTIFSTNTVRTISTAQPLSNLIGIPVILYNSANDSLDFFIQRIKSIRQGNVLIVGHSNTVDDIVNKLCTFILIPADLKDSEYDNLFIVTKKGKKYEFSVKTYGTVTE